MLSLLRNLFGPKRKSDGPLTAEALCREFGAPSEVVAFRHVPGGEVVFGPGRLELLGRKARELGGSRALLVTDPGLRRAGHGERAMRALERARLKVTVFDAVRENPTTLDVDRAVAVAKGSGVDLIVGLGGGSSMDTAKGCNFLLTNGGHMRDYRGIGKAQHPMLPFIAVPTTAGTGSECQSFALIADEESHLKMACGDKKAAAAVAILDPELTLTQPPGVTACTGVDALAHAVETAVCRKRTPVSAAYSRLAFALLNRGFEEVLADPDDLEARSRMQLGAAYAGTAIENSMLGAAHSTANPLTARYGIVHGRAVGSMLPHVVRRNRIDPDAAAIYRSLHPDLESRLVALMGLAGWELPLRSHGVSADGMEELAAQAAEQWTAQFNPVAFTVENFAEIYREAW